MSHNHILTKSFLWCGVRTRHITRFITNSFWYGGIIVSRCLRSQQHIFHARLRETIKLFAWYRTTCWELVYLSVTTPEGRWRRFSVYSLLFWLSYGFGSCICFTVQRLRKPSYCIGELPFIWQHLTKSEHLGAIYEYVFTCLECRLPAVQYCRSLFFFVAESGTIVLKLQLSSIQYVVGADGSLLLVACLST